jgi:hypothetical protein
MEGAKGVPGVRADDHVSVMVNTRCSLHVFTKYAIRGICAYAYVIRCRACGARDWGKPKPD